jgi:hypothetical protein
MSSIIVAGLALSGCTTSEPDNTTSPSPPLDFEGRWQTGPGSDSLTFSINGSIFGTAGCETFSGSYAGQVAKVSSIDGVTFDDSRCADESPTDFHDIVAGEFSLAMLSTGNLELSPINESSAITFARAALAVSDLRGTWLLVSGHDEVAEIALDNIRGQMRLSVGEHGVGGTNDCNSLGYTWAGPEEPSIIDADFPFDSFATTEVGCDSVEPDQTPAPSGSYLGALSVISNAEFGDGELVLTGPATELRFIEKDPVK